MRLTRRRSLLMGAAVLAAPAAARGAISNDQRQKLAQKALAEALQVEQTAVVAYEAIANSGHLSNRITSVLRALQDDDREHADQLVTALENLGVKPPIPPRRATIQGLAHVRTDPEASEFAIVLERRAVAAYLEVVRNLSDANLLRTVSGAMGTDGQHLVVLRELSHRPPVSGAFERG